MLELKGVFTALVTPMKDEGEVDYEAFERLLDAQIAGGVAGIVPVGTTGESPSLTSEEKIKIFELCVRKCKGTGVKVIAGTGTNVTATTIEATQKAKKAGVDAALVVIPYYNKPNQAGMFEHFKAVAEKGGLPIVLYNIPGRCGVQLNAETVAKLRQACPNIVAIKESTGSLDMSTEIASLCDIQILSGDDSLTLPIMSIGGTGVISVLSNFAPERVRAVVDPALKGDFATAAKAHRLNFKLVKHLFIEPNPQPTKSAMQMLGMIDNVLRLPMVPASAETQAKVTAVMKELGYFAEKQASPAKKMKN
jgi:4-hydroxy-tetrahydrodipicolinate synthase